MVYMEKSKEIIFSGAINPEKMIAKFQEKIDKQGRVPVPRMVRDKLGMQGREAIVNVVIEIVEIYPVDAQRVEYPPIEMERPKKEVEVNG